MEKKPVKQIVILIFCLFLLLEWTHAGTRFLAGSGQGDPSTEQAFVPGQLVVKLVPDSGTVQFASKAKPFLPQMEHRAFRRSYSGQITHMRETAIAGSYLLELHDGCDAETFQRQLQADARVEAVSLNYIAEITALTPNDPNFDRQYSLNNTGQVFFEGRNLQGISGSDIDAPQGWEWTTGGEGVVVAVIDTGVAGDHEDLVGKVIPGYNFVADNDNAYDDNGHGTFVSSIVAANTNNGLGIAGVSWNSKIMPIKAMNSAGKGSYLAIAAGIRFAADHGAHIINLSIGGANPSFILEDASQYAFEKGCVIVASGGNHFGAVLYPAAYDDYCLAVAATDYRDERVQFSNFGPQIDVAAPGLDIIGAEFSPRRPDQLDQYSWDSGTSYATPIVAGAAALLMHYKPFLSNEGIMKMIKFTADDINSAEYPGVDDYLGYGRLNLGRLLGPYEVNSQD